MKVTLTVVEGPRAGTKYEFEQHDTFIVGRAPNAQFRLPQDDLFFSRNHFLIEINPPFCRLLDLNSRNGTFVNGHRVATHELRHGDKIRGGKTTIAVEFVSQGRRNWVRDYETTRDEYLAIGIREYWIINRFDRTLTVWAKTASGRRKRVIREPQTYHTDLLPGFELPLKRLLELATRWADDL